MTVTHGDPLQRTPVVAVVGRPNVGKSSLVNRVVGRRSAIVEEQPGVTRDRNVIEAAWRGVTFTMVDTGGWLAGSDGLDGAISRQAEKAVETADVVLLVVDATVGITHDDEAVARMLARAACPVVVVANKVDGPEREADGWNLVRLGLGSPWMVSALHGRGSGDLLDEVVRILGDAGFAAPPTPVSEAPSGRGTAGDEGAEGAEGEAAAVAIVGRPNVGKSTLFNRLIGDERAIVHDMPGTTRDAIDTVVETEAGRIRFVDTAGMRRRSKVGEGAEYYSIVRTLQAVDRSDVALLVIDVTAGVTHQDQRLAERIDAAGSPVVMVLNKWEVLDAEGRARLRAEVADRLGFLEYAPVLPTSALTGRGVHKVVPALDAAIEAYHHRVPTRQLNLVIQAIQAEHPAPGARILYAVQGAASPPTFTLFASRRLQPTYLRFVERRLREELDLGPTALKLRVRLRGKG